MKTGLGLEKNLFALLLKIFMVFSKLENVRFTMKQSIFTETERKNVENKPNSEQIWYLFVILEWFVICFQ